MKNQRERFEDLLFSEIDGLISDSEQRELESLLAANPEFAREAAQHRQLHQLFDEAASVKAPPELAKSACDILFGRVSPALVKGRGWLTYGLTAVAASLLVGSIGVVALLQPDMEAPEARMETLSAPMAVMPLPAAEPAEAPVGLSRARIAGASISDDAAQSFDAVENQITPLKTLAAASAEIDSSKPDDEAVGRAELSALFSHPDVGVLIDTPWESVAQGYLGGTPTFDESGREDSRRHVVVDVGSEESAREIASVLEGVGASPIVNGPRIQVPYDRNPRAQLPRPPSRQPGEDDVVTGSDGDGFSGRDKPETGEIPIFGGEQVPRYLENEDDFIVAIEAMGGDFLFLTDDRQAAIQNSEIDQVLPTPTGVPLYFVFQFPSLVDGYLAMTGIELFFGPGIALIDIGTIELIGDHTVARIIIPRQPLKARRTDQQGEEI